MWYNMQGAEGKSVFEYITKPCNRDIFNQDIKIRF